MKLLVTGVGGQLGTKIYELSSHKNYGTYFVDNPGRPDANLMELNLLERGKVLESIKNINPEWVVHCAAATDVDWCEREKSTAWDINVEATRNVVDACKKINAGIVYISTSFVFNGSKNIVYEEDEPNPINNYGLTKLEGENIVKVSGLPFIITRTDHLYGWIGKGRKQNFVVRTLDALKGGKKIEIFQDWYNTPTLIDNLAEVILKLLELGKLGVYHAVGSSFINRYELAIMIADVFGQDKDLIAPVNSEKYKLPARRPNANAGNSKVQKTIGIKMLTVREGLEFMKSQMRNHLDSFRV